MEVNAKGKVRPKAVYEGLEGEQRYSSTVSLTSALDAGGWLTPRHWPLNPRERDPVPIVQEAGWAPGPVWMDAENIFCTGIRSLDYPATSESLHRLYGNEIP
jgi:hypothetical protein